MLLRYIRLCVFCCCVLVVLLYSIQHDTNRGAFSFPPAKKWAASWQPYDQKPHNSSPKNALLESMDIGQIEALNFTEPPHQNFSRTLSSSSSSWQKTEPTPMTQPPNAYVFYATEDDYACSVLINIDRLVNFFRTRHRIFVLVSPTVSERFLISMRKLNATVSVHEPPSLHHKTNTIYDGCLLKLLAFKLHQSDLSIKRALVLDGDQLILRNLDHVFELPSVDLAAPRAYWSPKGTITTSFMLISLSDRLWSTIDQKMGDIKEGMLDTDIVNDALGKTALVLPGSYVTLNSHWESWIMPDWFRPEEIVAMNDAGRTTGRPHLSDPEMNRQLPALGWAVDKWKSDVDKMMREEDLAEEQDMPWGLQKLRGQVARKKAHKREVEPQPVSLQSRVGLQLAVESNQHAVKPRLMKRMNPEKALRPVGKAAYNPLTGKKGSKPSAKKGMMKQQKPLKAQKSHVQPPNKDRHVPVSTMSEEEPSFPTDLSQLDPAIDRENKAHGDTPIQTEEAATSATDSVVKILENPKSSNDTDSKSPQALLEPDSESSRSKDQEQLHEAGKPKIEPEGTETAASDISQSTDEPEFPKDHELTGESGTKDDALSKDSTESSDSKVASDLEKLQPVKESDKTDDSNSEDPLPSFPAEPPSLQKEGASDSEKDATLPKDSPSSDDEETDDFHSSEKTHSSDSQESDAPNESEKTDSTDADSSSPESGNKEASENEKTDKQSEGENASSDHVASETDSAVSDGPTETSVAGIDGMFSSQELLQPPSTPENTQLDRNQLDPMLYDLQRVTHVLHFTALGKPWALRVNEVRLCWT